MGRDGVTERKQECLPHLFITLKLAQNTNKRTLLEILKYLKIKEGGKVTGKEAF